MTKAKKLILCGVALIVLIGAVVALSLLKPADTPEESSAPTLPGEVIFSRGEDEIASIALRNGEAAFTMVSAIETSGDASNPTETVVWHITDYPTWDLNSSAVHNLTSLGATVSSYNKVAKVAEANLADFGLDEPQAVLTICYTDGTETVLSVGDFTVDGSYVYMMLSDQEDIFTVSKSVATYGAYTLLDMRNVAFWNINTEYSVHSLLVDKPGQRTIQIRTAEEGEVHEGVYDGGTLRFVKPFTSNLAVVNGYLTTILSNMPNVSAEKFIEADAADLDQYGLGETNYAAHVKIVMFDSKEVTETDEDGNDLGHTLYTYDYYFGNAADDETTYFRQGGSADVYTIASARLEHIETDPFAYLQHLYYIQKIDDMDTVTFADSATGAAHMLHMIHREVPKEDGAEGETEIKTAYYFDGELIDKDPATQVYQDLIGIASDYAIYDQVPDYDPKTRLTIHFTECNGNEVDVVYYKHLANTYVIQLEDGIWLSCNQAQFDRLWDAVKVITG